MHKMFLDYGKYNFIQQIPQIIYSSLISIILSSIILFLSFFIEFNEFYEFMRFVVSEKGYDL